MSGIICWACLILAISVPQFALLQWRSAFNPNQENKESQQNQDLWWIQQRGCHRSCRVQLHQTLGKTWYGYQDPGKSVVVDDRSGKPEKPSPPGYSKLHYGPSWSSQEWKSEATAHDRSVKRDETSWNAMQQVRPHHEELLLESVRYGEIIHDGSVKPDSVNYQEEAESETFVMEVTQQNSWTN